jgi:hypothetical protein
VDNVDDDKHLGAWKNCSLAQFFAVFEQIDIVGLNFDNFLKFKIFCTVKGSLPKER